MFIDSHVHLADAAFAADVDTVIQRARAAGARALVCIGESPAAATSAQQLASRYPGFVFHTCGVHPHIAAEWDAERDGQAIREAVANGAVAVGECGLDYHYNNAPREQQRSVLAQHLDLAAELKRPLVLHTRDAEDDTIAMLRDAEVAGVQGVLHCYTGSHRLAEHAIAVGWYVSFSGIITFKKWDDYALLRLVPNDRLLLESDAPYLAPVPYRGKRNESSYVVHSLEKLAQVRNTTVEQVGAQTVANTQRFYQLPLAAAGASSSGTTTV